MRAITGAALAAILAAGLAGCTKTGLSADRIATIHGAAQRGLIACDFASSGTVAATVDGIAGTYDGADELAKVRAARQLGCLVLGGIAVATMPPIPVPKPLP